MLFSLKRRDFMPWSRENENWQSQIVAEDIFGFKLTKQLSTGKQIPDIHAPWDIKLDMYRLLNLLLLPCFDFLLECIRFFTSIIKIFTSSIHRILECLKLQPTQDYNFMKTK